MTPDLGRTIATSFYDFLLIGKRADQSSPIANTAVGVCQARETDPFALIYVGGIPMERWRAVIVEVAMVTAIGDEMKK